MAKISHYIAHNPNEMRCHLARNLRCPSNIVLDRGHGPMGMEDLGVGTPSLHWCRISPNYFGPTICHNCIKYWAFSEFSVTLKIRPAVRKPASLCAQTLYYWKSELARHWCMAGPGRWQFLWQNQVTIIRSTHVDSRIDEYQTSVAQQWHGDWHHQQ